MHRRTRGKTLAADTKNQDLPIITAGKGAVGFVGEVSAYLQFCFGRT
jgi:hypothetical protein